MRCVRDCIALHSHGWTCQAWLPAQAAPAQGCQQLLFSAAVYLVQMTAPGQGQSFHFLPGQFPV